MQQNLGHFFGGEGLTRRIKTATSCLFPPQNATNVQPGSYYPPWQVLGCGIIRNHFPVTFKWGAEVTGGGLWFPTKAEPTERVGEKTEQKEAAGMRKVSGGKRILPAQISAKLLASKPINLLQNLSGLLTRQTTESWRVSWVLLWLRPANPLRGGGGRKRLKDTEILSTRLNVSAKIHYPESKLSFWTQ